MATSPPPDRRPTEALRPAPPVYEERVVAPAVDPTVILVRLEDAVGALRTGLTIVGIIAVAALAVAIYGLVTDGSGTRSGSRAGLASDERVSSLEDRADRLSRQVQALRSSGSTSSAGDTALADRVAAIERTVKTLADRPATDATQAVQELSSRIDEVAKDVEALKQAQQTAP